MLAKKWGILIKNLCTKIKDCSKYHRFNKSRFQTSSVFILMSWCSWWAGKHSWKAFPSTSAQAEMQRVSWTCRDSDLWGFYLNASAQTFAVLPQSNEWLAARTQHSVVNLGLSEEATGLDTKIWGGFSQFKAKNHLWLLLTLNQQTILTFKPRFVRLS